MQIQRQRPRNFISWIIWIPKTPTLFFGGSNHPMYTIKTPTKSSKRLLLVKDSYANSFMPFLAQSYREIVVVDPRYFFDNIDDIDQSGGNHRSDVPLQCKYVLQRQFPRNDAQLIIFCPKSQGYLRDRIYAGVPQPMAGLERVV